jgi:carbon storage regulator
MLALSRKIGEKIMIGDQITLKVLEIKGDNVRLGIDAPKDIKIYRGEIYDAIANENKSAQIAQDLTTGLAGLEQWMKDNPINKK